MKGIVKMLGFFLGALGACVPILFVISIIYFFKYEAPILSVYKRLKKGQLTCFYPYNSDKYNQHLDFYIDHNIDNLPKLTFEQFLKFYQVNPRS